MYNCMGVGGRRLQQSFEITGDPPIAVHLDPLDEMQRQQQ